MNDSYVSMKEAPLTIVIVIKWPRFSASITIGSQYESIWREIHDEVHEVK